MTPFEIRQATLADIDLLMSWRMRVLAEVFAPLDPSMAGPLADANRRYYEQTLADGSHLACFALSGGEAVGCGDMCLQTEMPSPDNPAGRCAYLMNIYTLPSHRRQGIGRAVVGWLAAEARSRGIGKIYLEASDAGAPLYAEMGFKEMKGMMKLNIVSARSV